jgi:hypothetical protein
LSQKLHEKCAEKLRHQRASHVRNSVEHQKRRRNYKKQKKNVENVKLILLNFVIWRFKEPEGDKAKR